RLARSVSDRSELVDEQEWIDVLEAQRGERAANHETTTLGLAMSGDDTFDGTHADQRGCEATPPQVGTSVCPVRADVSQSHLPEAAIDAELGAGDVRAVIGTEERDDLRDVVGMTDASERHAISILLREAIAVGANEPLQARRVDQTGTDDVHADLSRFQ